MAIDQMQTASKSKAKATEGWDFVRLGDHVTKVGSGLTPTGGEAAYKKSGIPLIRSQNVHMNRFEHTGLAFISEQQDAEMKGSRVAPGDVLLNITGASIGRVCVVPSELCPANVNQHVCIIRGDGSFDPAFLAFYLSTPDFQKFINSNQSGATRQALTKEMIEDFDIPKPDLTEQHRIVEMLRHANRLRVQQWEAERQVEHLYQTLLHRAFKQEL